MMSFPDFPYPSDLPSFIQSTHVLQYLKDYMEPFDLDKYIQVCLKNKIKWGS